MKRNLKTIGGRILSILFVIFLTACGSGGGGGGSDSNTNSGSGGGSGGNSNVTLSSITVTQTITFGPAMQYEATGTYSDNSTQDITASVTWSSSNTGVATINDSGLATFITAGTTTITAMSGSVSGTITLTLKASAQAFPIGTWDGPDGVSVTISQLVVDGGKYEANQFLGSVTFLGRTIVITSVTDPYNYIRGHCFYPYCGDKRTKKTDWYLVTASDLMSATPVGAIGISFDTITSNTQITGSIDIVQWDGNRYTNDNAIFTLQ